MKNSTTSRPSRSPTSPARRPTAWWSMSMSRRSRPASSRSRAATPPRRDFLGSQHRRPQSDGPRSIRQGDGELRPVFAGRTLSYVEPYLLGYRDGRRHRSILPAESGELVPVLQHGVHWHQFAARFCADRGIVVPAALLDLSADDHVAYNLNNCQAFAQCGPSRRRRFLLRRRRDLRFRFVSNWPTGRSRFAARLHDRV